MSGSEYYPQYPGQPPQPRKRHRVRNVLLVMAGAFTVLIILIVALGAASTPKPVARPAVSAAPAAAPAKPVATTPPAPVVLGHFAGSGDYSSPPFTVNGNPVTVVYSYSGNILPGETSGNNFMADVESSGDSQQIANTIGTSGGTTTTLYPDTSYGGSTSYHLSVQATGNWSVTLTEAG